MGCLYRSKSIANQAQPLNTKHHGTYRAELRAVTHVITAARHPVLMRVDNKAVVTQLEKVLAGETVDSNHPDYDLWSIIMHITNGSSPQHFRVQWMPAHLEEP